MRNKTRGFTLIELVITVTVLSILTLGVVPLMKLSAKRQKELQLRDSLRQIRSAIDEFHRDTVGINCSGTTAIQTQQQGPSYVDPRSKVVISDCTIFGVDNPDRYPPSLEMLKEGVNVIPRGGNATQIGNRDVNATDINSQLSTKKKVYLREIPKDPMTGERDWCMRSSYDSGTTGCSGGGENLFDVYSKSEDKALNGDKYSDW